MDKRLIIREVSGSYDIPCNILAEQDGYEILNLLNQEEKPIQSKTAWLLQGIRSWKQVILRFGQIREANHLILIGNYMSLFTVLLNKLHIIHPQKLYWWGFQIRGEKMQKLLRVLFKFLYSPNLIFVLFSEYERSMYSSRLGLKEDCFLSIHYGDWKRENIKPPAPDSQIGDYYFSGGYSNRDYRNLIDAWKEVDRRLVIIGSKNNEDLYSYQKKPTNPRIKVMMDTSPEIFDRYHNGSKACIFPFKSDSGAAGQTVALKCMKRRKLIVSKDIMAMREYTDYGRTGFLIKDLKKELPDLIRKIESDESEIRHILDEQERLFDNSFSYEVISKELADTFR